MSIAGRQQGNVEDTRVYEYLQDGLDDVARFGERIARHQW